jgi:hypothetical protein
MRTVVQLPTNDKRAIDVYSPAPELAVERDSRQQPQAKEENVPADIGRPRRAILKALTFYHFLTAEQITRLLYSPTSYTYVNKHLQYLVKNGLVEWVLPAKQMLLGRAPYVYTLSREGRTVAKDLGFPVLGRYRAEGTHKAYPIAHVLAVNEFLIKTALLSKTYPDIMLRKLIHDKELFASPLPVKMPGQRKPALLRPDSWIDMGQKSLRRRYCFCLEMNLTEITSPNKWKEVVRKYLYCIPAYKERFGTPILTVLVSIQTATDFPVKSLESLTPEEQDERKQAEKDRRVRLETLRLWTEAEAKTQNKVNEAGMFYFSSAPLDVLTPTELYFSPHWSIPYHDTPVSLLQNPEEEVLA